MQYEPTWESVGQHPVPAWFHDAKLGIFVHWGLYSVPGWAPPAAKTSFTAILFLYSSKPCSIGHHQALSWEQDGDNSTLTLPSGLPKDISECPAYALRTMSQH